MQPRSTGTMRPAALCCLALVVSVVAPRAQDGIAHEGDFLVVEFEEPGGEPLGPLLDRFGVVLERPLSYPPELGERRTAWRGTHRIHRDRFVDYVESILAAEGFHLQSTGSGGLSVRDGADMPHGLPSLLLSIPEPGETGTTGKAPEADRLPRGHAAPDMPTFLLQCMIESRIGKRFTVQLQEPVHPRHTLSDDAEALDYTLLPETAEASFTTAELARFLVFIERHAPAEAVVSRIELTEAPEGGPSADRWHAKLDVTRVVSGSRATPRSALTTWVRLTRAVGESPEARAGCDLTRLEAVVEQDQASIAVSGRVESLHAYTELLRVASSLTATMDVAPGELKLASDSSMTFTGLTVRLQDD